jgi:phosphoglucomutase
MAAGFSCMNSVTVIQASQGLAKFIKETYRSSEQPAVVIGHNARHNSKKFAALSVNSFSAVGIQVWWYGRASPTPFVPYGVILKRATATVMITASHVSIRLGGISSRQLIAELESCSR